MLGQSVHLQFRGLSRGAWDQEIQDPAFSQVRSTSVPVACGPSQGHRTPRESTCKPLGREPTPSVMNCWAGSGNKGPRRQLDAGCTPPTFMGLPPAPVALGIVQCVPTIACSTQKQDMFNCHDNRVQVIDEHRTPHHRRCNAFTVCNQTIPPGLGSGAPGGLTLKQNLRLVAQAQQKTPQMYRGLSANFCTALCTHRGHSVEQMLWVKKKPYATFATL